MKEPGEKLLRRIKLQNKSVPVIDDCVSYIDGSKMRCGVGACVYSDNLEISHRQAALLALSTPLINFSVVNNCKTALSSLAGQLHLSLIWVPGHENVVQCVSYKFVKYLKICSQVHICMYIPQQRIIISDFPPDKMCDTLIKLNEQVFLKIIWEYE